MLLILNKLDAHREFPGVLIIKSVQLQCSIPGFCCQGPALLPYAAEVQGQVGRENLLPPFGFHSVIRVPGSYGSPKKGPPKYIQIKSLEPVNVTLLGEKSLQM